MENYACEDLIEPMKGVVSWQCASSWSVFCQAELIDAAQGDYGRADVRNAFMQVKENLRRPLDKE